MKVLYLTDLYYEAKGRKYFEEDLYITEILKEHIETHYLYFSFFMLLEIIKPLFLKESVIIEIAKSSIWIRIFPKS